MNRGRVVNLAKRNAQKDKKTSSKKEQMAITREIWISDK